MTNLKKYLPTDRAKLRTWLLITGCLLTKINIVCFQVGIGFIVIGSMLHLWSKGHLQQNRKLTITGPYRWIRNPFYVANFFIDLGLCLIINQPILTLIYFCFWIYAYMDAILREEKALKSIFGTEYLEYRVKVPRLIPWKPPLKIVTSNKGFSWRNYNIVAGSEIPRLLRFVSYPLLLFLTAEFRKQGINYIAVSSHIFALAAYLFVVSLAYLLNRFLKKRKKSFSILN